MTSPRCSRPSHGGAAGARSRQIATEVWRGVGRRGEDARLLSGEKEVRKKRGEVRVREAFELTKCQFFEDCSNFERARKDAFAVPLT
jgi:hypothetical protein